MKRNVQVYTAQQINELLPEPHDNPQILENGDFSYVTSEGGKRVTAAMTANEVAYIINMPLWEVVTVDVLGEDEYALMFFEN